MNRAALATVALALMNLPAPATGQIGVLEGRVYDASSGAGLQNAVVELEGYGSILSFPDGYFRFQRVRSGTYLLRVNAFGYAPVSQSVIVNGDTSVDVPVHIAPLMLDSLLVESRAIEIEGRVRDPTRDLNVVGAEVLTDRAEPTWTGAHGRFSVDDVLAGVPLRLAIRAFGYLPLDTIVLPDEDRDYVLELERDSLVERMIEAQVTRIEDRASPLRAVLMRPMNRERLLRYTGYTLAGLIEGEYRAWLGRVRCVVLDEQALSPNVDGPTLRGMLPEEVERIEFLFQGAMLRIYTRDFMRKMIARNVELRQPVYIGGQPPFTPFCL